MVGLVDRAAQAFSQEGEEAYWNTLAEAPLERPRTNVRPIGSGYTDPPGGGHGQIANREVDRLFESRLK